MKNFFGEFGKFIQRGNVMDLAVGVVIGSAFSAIVTSLVNDIIMPVVGMIIGGVDFTHLSVTVGKATLNYGAFIQAVVNFLIVAFVLFVIVKAMNKLQEKIKKKEEEKKKDANLELLTEIRDILKKHPKTK